MSDPLPIDWASIRPVADRHRELASAPVLAFPFRVHGGRPELAGRAARVRDQIEMVLRTAPGERPHRPDWGVGVDRLVFDAGGPGLTAMVGQRLTAKLAEALSGEVDPASILVDVRMGGEATLVIRVSYRLATIGEQADHEFVVAVDAG